MNSTNIKELQSTIKKDLAVMDEIKKLIGTGGTYEEISRYQNILQYENVNDALNKMKENLHFENADKMTSVAKQVDKIRHENYNVCLYLNSLTPMKIIKSIVVEPKTSIQIWKTPDINFLKPDIQNCLNSISDQKIPVILSKNKVVDLVKMPHLLVAGQTGSGKSVFLNSLIVTILYKMDPNICKLVLIDPKRVEFSLFKNVPHLWRPVATQLDKISEVLDDLVKEMEDRYVELEKVSVKNLEEYNKQASKKLPYIVVVIDELADLMMVSSHSVENQITRLAQLARAIGIHVVMATQRPVVEIMTGLIKSNMPSRIAFKVASKQDSRVILDQNGAEVLNGNGDLLFMQSGSIERHQGIFISEDEIKNITGYKSVVTHDDSCSHCVDCLNHCNGHDYSPIHVLSTGEDTCENFRHDRRF